MHDHIGSNSPTPSGVETPRPDFHDKRSPGILPGFFGQVGREPSQSSPLRNAQAVITPAVDLSLSIIPPKHVRETSRRASTSSLGSMVMVERARVSTPPPDGQTPPKSPEPDPSRLPPTPISSAASVVHKGGDSAENGMPDSGIQSITQALRNFVLPKSSFGGKARRHQSLPVSSVTKSTVPAAHISNPASSAQSSRAQSPPDSPSPPQPQPSEETHGLTLDATSESREKATPPHTPRALSQEDRQRSPLAAEHVVETEKPSRIADPNLPTGKTRGKLAVKIAEGRNIKAAYDPYVVCVFEYNEYISRGPKVDRMDVDGEEPDPNPQLHSIPIRRTDSDMGRPMAIPMRSRQSSTNGTSDGQPMQKVTSPQWDHEALL